jgi:hypothetical protein
MSDFKNIKDFKKGSLSRYPYQDPTYLSFVLLFDFFDSENSPLLSKTAEQFLEKLADGNEYYAEKLEALINFKQALATINNNMPWYWQGLEGLERLQKYDPTKNYWGGDDAILKITTLESINLTVAGLMHLYKKAVFDEQKWNWVLPVNLRKFRMWAYVTEIRTIKNMSKPKINGINKDALRGFPDNFKPSIDIENDNLGISGQNARPYFMFGLTYCEFDMMSGSDFLSGLSKNPEGAAVGELQIKYENVEKVEARVLNGIIESSFGGDRLSPAPDSENKSFDNLGDFLIDKATDKIGGAISGAKEDLKRLAQQKKNEIVQEVRNRTVNRIPTFENVFQNALRKVDDATTVDNQRKSIGNAIQANVYDSVPPTGETRAALDAAAERALGNVND